MTPEDIKLTIEKTSGDKVVAVLTSRGEKISSLEQVFNPLPLPNYSGLYLSKSGVHVWDIYKDTEWKIRILKSETEKD